VRLTARQEQCLGAIRVHANRHGRPPTLRELAERVGIASRTGVMFHLHGIERKGWLVLAEGHRGIRLLPTVIEQVELLPCGLPLFVERPKED
jgi:SOS-response transcriptional repressor LexA